MIKNPVMFVVEAGFVVTLLLCFFPNLFGGDGNNNLTAYNAIVSAILLITLLFATCRSRGRRSGQAQAESLKKRRRTCRRASCVRTARKTSSTPTR